MILSKIKRNQFDFVQTKSFNLSSKRNFSCNNLYKLLSSYFKSGRVKEADNLFDKIPERNVVLWSILIHGYAINGVHRKSLQSFSRMRISGLTPNSFTLVGVLVTVQAQQDQALGKSIHGFILKNGFESDSVVLTALLDKYAKFGNLLDSCKIFAGMKNPSLVSCNAMIAGYMKNECFEGGLEVYNGFRKSGLVSMPNESTVLSILRGCVALECRTVCESVHGLAVKLGLDSCISINNSILDMYSCFMDLDAVCEVFDTMRYKDVISWTTMIGLLVNLEYASDAFSVFRRMRARNVEWVELDHVVMMKLVSACMVVGDLKRGKEIHAQAVVYGFESDVALANTLVAMYSKGGNLGYSRNIFEQITRKSLVSWTAMMSAFVQNGQPREALKLFMDVMLEDKFPIDSVMIVSAITASGDVMGFVFCQQLHCYSFQVGFHRYRSIQNSLVSSYSKCGNMDHAYDVFIEMGFHRDVVSWNAIINGFGINGLGQTAVNLYRQMRKSGEDADNATYSVLLSACSHGGLVEDGVVIFSRMMENEWIRPGDEHYGCIVDLLARAGCLSEATGLVGELLEVFGPNVLRALLSGCVVHGNVELAEVVAKRLFEVDPRETAQVVLLSNVYASVGRFQDAETLRMSIQKNGQRKNPGFSFSLGG